MAVLGTCKAGKQRSGTERRVHGISRELMWKIVGPEAAEFRRFSSFL